MTIGVGISPPLDETPLSGFWNAGGGVEGFLQTPFYLGTVQAGIQIRPHKAREPDLPDYQNRFFYLDWSNRIRLPINLTLSGGIRFGIVQMAFDDPTTTWHNRVDHELQAGLVASLEWAVVDRWSLRLTADRGKIFLSDPFLQTVFTFSICRILTTPEWLKDFLR